MTAPDWTDFNPSDPGLAILELFLFLALFPLATCVPLALLFHRAADGRPAES